MNPILDRIILALAGLLVLLGLGTAVYIEHERADKAQAEVSALSASLAASQSALDAYKASHDASAQRAATNQKKVSNALAANPDWTATRVPDDVWSSLYDNRPGTPASQPAASVLGAATAR